MGAASTMRGVAVMNKDALDEGCFDNQLCDFTIRRWYLLLLLLGFGSFI